EPRARFGDQGTVVDLLAVPLEFHREVDPGLSLGQSGVVEAVQHPIKLVERERRSNSPTANSQRKVAALQVLVELLPLNRTARDVEAERIQLVNSMLRRGTVVGPLGLEDVLTGNRVAIVIQPHAVIAAREADAQQQFF